MKQKLLLVSVMLMGMPALLWAAAETKPAANAALPFKDVSSKTAQAFCSKMEQCAKQKIPLSQCNSQMSEAFMQGYTGLAADKRPQVASDQLNQCVKSIDSSSCEALQKASSLAGCDFIGQLSS